MLVLEVVEAVVVVLLLLVAAAVGVVLALVVVLLIESSWLCWRRLLWLRKLRRNLCWCWFEGGWMPHNITGAEYVGAGGF